MKTITLLLLICTAVSLTAQDLSPQQAKHYADLLVKKQILSEKGKRILLHELENKNLLVEHSSTIYDTTYSTASVSKQSILLFLTRAFGSGLLHRQFDKNNTLERKIRPEDKLITSHLYSTMILGMGGYQYQDCIHPKRSTIGSTRTRTLGDLYSTELIDQKVFEEGQKALRWELVTNEYELLRLVTDRSIYYQFYDFNKKEQQNFTMSLVQTGILKQETFPEIQKQYTNYKLLTIPEILEFSHRYIVVELQHEKPNPSTNYPIVFEKVKTLLPSFKYNNLVIELKELSEDELIRQDVSLSFAIDGRNYQHSFFYNYRKNLNDSISSEVVPAKINENFHKGINNWLEYINSEYRIYTIKYFNEEKAQYQPDKFGLLLLKKAEVSFVLHPYMISEENF